jgi:hypothetical protein
MTRTRTSVVHAGVRACDVITVTVRLGVGQHWQSGAGRRLSGLDLDAWGRLDAVQHLDELLLQQGQQGR